jgi:hypothetical protein
MEMMIVIRKLLSESIFEIKLGTLVLRKPQQPVSGSAIYGRSLDIAPEPFEVVARSGSVVG